MKSKIAICQICSTGDIEHNLKISSDLVRKAVAEGAQACFLPEAADFIVPTQEETYNLSQSVSSHTYTQGLQKLAKELNVWIAAGIHELPDATDGEEIMKESKEGKKAFNSHVAINPEGEVVTAYRKLHLFDVALKLPASSTSEAQAHTLTGESARILRGTSLPSPFLFGPNLGPVGLEICYDLRFPELHEILVRRGAKVLVFPSAFTLRTGKDHWAILCKAIAIQYQVYVFAPTQAGAHNDTRSSWGEGLAFSPWGEELGRLESIDDYEKKGGDRTKPMPSSYFVVEIDMAEVDSVREQIPLAIQKRSDIYEVIAKDN